MADSDENILSLRIQQLEQEIQSLRLQRDGLKEKRSSTTNASSSTTDLPLELNEYIRYGRQMIIPKVGLPGQLALRRSSVLVIGAGGLGCPVLLYLGAAGIGLLVIDDLTRIGTLGIADHDRVDLSNLHRQILHRTGNVGELKTTSAARTLKEYLPSRDV